MELTWSGSPATRKTHLLYMLTFFLLEVEKDMAAHSVFLPGKSHGQRGLAGWSPGGRKSQKRLSD